MFGPCHVESSKGASPSVRVDLMSEVMEPVNQLSVTLLFLHNIFHLP